MITYIIQLINVVPNWNGSNPAYEAKVDTCPAAAFTLSKTTNQVIKHMYLKYFNSAKSGNRENDQKSIWYGTVSINFSADEAKLKSETRRRIPIIY